MKKIIAFFLIVSVVSCGETSERSDTIIDESSLDDFKLYQLDTAGQKIPFVDMIERVEFMRLEETDASLLSYISELVETEDYYFLNSGKEGDVYFFSKQGEYRSKINRKGEGPEEYTGIQDKWMTGDTLSVYSDEQQKIKQYLLDGTFVTALDVPVAASQVMPYSEGYVLDMNMKFIDDSLGYNVVLLDKNLDREKLQIPFKEELPFGVSTEFNGFKKYGEDMVYLRAANDTLFLFKDKQLTPLAKFDFGRNWLWNDEQVAKDPDNIVQVMQAGSAVWNLGVRVSKDWYYLNYMSDFFSRDGLMIDRATGEYRIIDYRVSREEKYTMNALTWKGDRLLFSISSPNVADLLSELDENQWEFREGTTLEEIESSENSVMMWVKFKETFRNELSK